MVEVGFTEPDIWSGGSYEVHVWWRDLDLDRLTRAERALWSHHALEGCYGERDVEPTEQDRLEPAALTLDVEDGAASASRYGLATLDGARLPSRSSTIGDLDEAASDRVLDVRLWFGLTTSALGSVYDVGAYPFRDDSRPADWQPQVDAWLCDLARLIHGVEPVDGGVVGWEVPSFDTDAPAHWLAHGIPEERWIGYLVPRGDELDFLPSNVGRAPMELGGA